MFENVSRQGLVDIAHKTRLIEDQWCKEIFVGKVDDAAVERHNAWRINNMLSSVGLEDKDTSLSNPIKDLYLIGNYGDGSQSKSNVLETKSASYTNAGTLAWDGSF